MKGPLHLLQGKTKADLYRSGVIFVDLLLQAFVGLGFVLFFP